MDSSFVAQKAYRLSKIWGKDSGHNHSVVRINKGDVQLLAGMRKQHNQESTKG